MNEFEMIREALDRCGYDYELHEYVDGVKSIKLDTYWLDFNADGEMI